LGTCRFAMFDRESPPPKRSSSIFVRLETIRSFFIIYRDQVSIFSLAQRTIGVLEDSLFGTWNGLPSIHPSQPSKSFWEGNRKVTAQANTSKFVLETCVAHRILVQEQRRCSNLLHPPCCCPTQLGQTKDPFGVSSIIFSRI